MEIGRPRGVSHGGYYTIGQGAGLEARVENLKTISAHGLGDGHRESNGRCCATAVCTDALSTRAAREADTRPSEEQQVLQTRIRSLTG